MALFPGGVELAVAEEATEASIDELDPLVAESLSSGTRGGCPCSRRSVSMRSRSSSRIRARTWCAGGSLSAAQFRAGMNVEPEHGRHDPATDVTGDDPQVTGKIALAHPNEFPDYYTRLERMEDEARRESGER